MKISNTGNSSLQQVYQSQVERASQGGAASQHSALRAGEKKDSVELSSQAQLMQKAAQAASKEGPARLKRIDQLRHQIQNDSYQVPVQQLAQRMMSELF